VAGATSFAKRSRRVFAATVLVLATVAAGPGVAAPAARQAEPESTPAGWRQISAGSSHTCGIRTTGRLYCWGADFQGQLGDGGTDTGHTTPVQVAGGRTDWRSVSVGEYHTCARRGTGRLFCWGSNQEHQLGDNGTEDHVGVPVQVFGGATDWTAVGAGQFHTCARRSSGRLFCWGDDLYGHVGDGGTPTDRARPVQVAGGATNWTTFSVGSRHTCALRDTGRLFCWGWDEQGQLGDGGGNVDAVTPVQVAGGVRTWVGVSAGYSHTCGRRSSRRVFCWGDDVSGQLGNGGTAMDAAMPVQIAGGRTDWVGVSAGGFHNCARRSSGQLFCWGQDAFGALGDGPSNPPQQPAPVAVAGNATNWRRLDLGLQHSCSLTTAARAYCWGYDSYGQLGDVDDTNLTRSTPSEVASP
jgi:alpha-tubulin suppressor-like RCC1 family protein